MLVSNSPCSKCREDLQALFISCDVPNVCFTLRIARLCLEKSTPDEAERKLDYWIKDLEARKIRVCLSAINVIPEIAMLTKKVSSMNDEQRSTRIYEDTKIKRQIDNIQNGTTHVTKLIKHFKLVWSGFTRTYFIDESDEQMILLQLIVSGVTRSEQRPTEIRESHKVDGDGDHLFEKAIHEIKTRIPLSWGSIRKCLVLVCAHVPSTKCQERITEFLGEKKLDRVKNKLVLYIAKVPVGKERRNFIEWIEHLEGNLIHVCLQPFYAPFPSLSGQIIDQYVILKTEFQTLKRELESRMSPPLSETQSPQSFSPDSDEDMSS